ncbi:hypothetical protein AQUCO_09400028v1 [Aquilegia coerulea]|uniref:Uncharacterized protein n=1 Tax=Aquilegia coerulea TaxID=218851 RepID=A0A2G5C6E9_AQUCA|nr:hypothetical protein AQUCO_09400028v1 [Aquilegia coerulea]
MSFRWKNGVPFGESQIRNSSGLCFWWHFLPNLAISTDRHAKMAIEMDHPPRFMEDVGPVSLWAASTSAGLSGAIAAAAASQCFDTA